MLGCWLNNKIGVLWEWWFIFDKNVKVDGKFDWLVFFCYFWVVCFFYGVI